jgi:hypothetical protein
MEGHRAFGTANEDNLRIMAHRRLRMGAGREQEGDH